MNFVKISWEKYEKDCIALAKKVVASKIKFDRIMAISRGGLTNGRLFSDLLNLPISHITISSYSDLKQGKNIEIVETSNKSFSDNTLLLIDDLSYTGKTFRRALSYFKKFSNCKVYSLSLYVKPKTTYFPNFWQEEIDAWIVFPYEINETHKALVKKLKSPIEAKRKLIKLGFKEWEINC